MQVQAGPETKPSPVRGIRQDTLSYFKFCTRCEAELSALHRHQQKASSLIVPSPILFFSGFPPGSLIQVLGQAGAEERSDRGDQEVVREDLALAAEATL